MFAVNNWTDCLVMLQQAQVDAISTDDSVLWGLKKQDPNVDLVGDSIGLEPYGIGINKEHSDLVRFVNGVLDRRCVQTEHGNASTTNGCSNSDRRLARRPRAMRTDHRDECATGCGETMARLRRRPTHEARQAARSSTGTGTRGPHGVDEVWHRSRPPRRRRRLDTAGSER